MYRINSTTIKLEINKAKTDPVDTKLDGTKKYENIQAPMNEKR